MKNIEPIIEKLKALRERLPIPKYESGYFLTDEEWDQIFSALEENEKLKESCSNVFIQAYLMKKDIAIHVER